MARFVPDPQPPDSYACGIACVACVLRLSYEQTAKRFFNRGTEFLPRGYTWKELRKALRRAGRPTNEWEQVRRVGIEGVPVGSIVLFSNWPAPDRSGCANRQWNGLWLPGLG